LALAALEALVAHDEGCEPASVNCDAAVDMPCAGAEAPCRANELSVRGARLLDDSLDSAEKKEQVN